MMQGKIVSDGGDYVVKMGGVTINITNDVRNLIEQETARMTAIAAQERVHFMASLESYRQIVKIVLADSMPRPVGQGEGNPWAPTG
jgi:hypothetical protein